MDIKLIEKTPSVEDYAKLRKSVGWKVLEEDKIRQGLANSVYCVCVENKGELIGFGRLVGDGATVFYIQDIIVSPAYQKQKLGTLIMKKIMEYIKNICSPDAIIGLIAYSNLDGFYRKFGFAYKENNRFYRYGTN